MVTTVGRAVRVLDLVSEGCRFESHSGRNWKTLMFHPAVNGCLTIVGEGLKWRTERIGRHLPYAT